MPIPMKTDNPGPTAEQQARVFKEAVAAPPSVVDPALVGEMLHNTMVIYGPTGSRKTSQIGEFAKYIYEKTGKTTRLVSCDGGGWAPIQDLINAGIIEAWRLVDEPSLLGAITAASKGAWPKNLKNGIRPSGPVVVPDPAGRVRELSNVGAYAIEGWFSIASAVMRFLVARGQKINEDVVSKFTETTDFGEFSYGAPSRGHYGFVQSYILDVIRNFSSLPVERILYTSLEGKGEDKLTKGLQYGPAVAGSAITAAIPQYVGDCLHFEDFLEEGKVDPTNPKQKLVETKIKAWFTSHPDPQTGVIWPAKARLVPSKVPEFKRLMGEPGYFVLGEKSLYDYLKVQDQLLASSSDEARKWKEAADAARAKMKSEGNVG